MMAIDGRFDKGVPGIPNQLTCCPLSCDPWPVACPSGRRTEFLPVPSSDRIEGCGIDADTRPVVHGHDEDA